MSLRNVYLWFFVPMAMIMGCHDNGGNATAPAPAVTGQPPAGQTTPAAVANVQGVWKGIVGGPQGTTDATLTLSQSGSAFSGTFAIPGTTGNASGSVTGNTLTVALSPSNPVVCEGQLSGTGTVNGDNMTLNLVVASSHPLRVTTSTGTMISSVESSTGTITCPAAALTGQGRFTRVTTTTSTSIVF